VIFFDASAAAKRYFREIGSDRVDDLWSGLEFFSSLAILHCELVSALNRKLRERALPPGAYHTLKEQIRQDAMKIWAVPVNAELIGVSVRLLDSPACGRGGTAKRWVRESLIAHKENNPSPPASPDPLPSERAVINCLPR